MVEREWDRDCRSQSHARWPPDLELALEVDGLRPFGGVDLDGIAVDIGQLQPELVVLVGLVPGNLDDGADAEWRRLRASERPAGADDRELFLATAA